MSPLTSQCLDFNTGRLDNLVGGEGHVRVDVPILHALNDVDRAVVILNHTVKEGALSPVIVAGIGHHASRKVGCWPVHIAFEVPLAQRVSVFTVAVNTEGTVDAVVHDHPSCFHAAVAPHQFVDANEAGHGNDGGEVGVAEGCGLPRG